ncbi:MAG: hypothetical protein LBB14_02360 [Puniceicoccales bacterium]|jgi:tetratricopeptide (TPR) repeat protein|nr:hypothetical protein [Puniceicoccales bacterium]
METTDREFLSLLGYLYLQYGRWDEARVVYGSLVELSDRQPLLLLTYAYCLAQVGQYAVALHHLDGLEGKDFLPKARSAYRLLRGNVLWYLGRDEEARKELELFLRTERKRARLEPTRPSFIVRSAAERVQQLVEEPERWQRSGRTSDSREGMWRRLLRFIARKELSQRRS